MIIYGSTLGAGWVDYVGYWISEGDGWSPITLTLFIKKRYLCFPRFREEDEGLCDLPGGKGDYMTFLVSLHELLIGRLYP